MSTLPNTPPVLDYPRMVHEALRDVARQVLARVAEEGLPGEHHFFLSFKTADPGVRVPSFLRDLHPEEMTVVLQNRFWDLAVDREAFSVTLTFGGRRERIAVPFAALTAFVDPSVPFGLRFEPPPDEAAAEDRAGEERGSAPGSGLEPAPGAEDDGNAGAAGSARGEGARVVPLDRFRKRD